MSEPKKVRTTSEGCVNEHDVMHLGKRPKLKYRVQTYEGPVTRTFVFVMASGKQMLADIITGTLYDPKTGRSNSRDLTLLGAIK